MMIEHVINFLACPTPDEWIKVAISQLDLLLLDHANCEKKAASTALNFMFRYPEQAELILVMSRIAREELRHFEQVWSILKKREITFRLLAPGRYAKTLHQYCYTSEPLRLIDHLIIGAIIEARSCERFAALINFLPQNLADFYFRLLKSEARHFEVYLRLAHDIAGNDLSERIAHFVNIEKTLILEPDADFRFHSGIPLN
ncbi:MAG: hypothetical protein LEGION0398_MBIBDBAK_00369 [Legionellaceae bacterium]